MNPITFWLLVFLALVIFLVGNSIYRKIEDENKRRIFRRSVCIGIAACIALFISFRIIYIKNSQGDTASSTGKNCELVHDIYINRDPEQRSFVDRYLTDWDSYSKETLYNLGLCSTNHAKWHADVEEKKWNGTWIVTEDFIKQYVEKYSADEFIEVYNLYVASYIEPVVDSPMLEDYYMDEKFYDQNPQLLKHITETTKILFELTDSFDVVHYNPATDQVMNKTSNTETIEGKFNVGKDNHIETRTAELTTDTYEYDGYIVEHVYGKKYSQGEYGYNKYGDFVDTPASFYSVDEYTLKAGHCWVHGNSLEEIECKWIHIRDEDYYLRRIDGIKYVNPKSFSQPVFVLTQSSIDADEHYVDYD